MEYSDSISALLTFGISLSKAYPQDFSTPPFTLYASDFFVIGFNVCAARCVIDRLLRI